MSTTSHMQIRAAIEHMRDARLRQSQPEPSPASLRELSLLLSSHDGSIDREDLCDLRSEVSSAREMLESRRDSIRRELDALTHVGRWAQNTKDCVSG